MSAPNLFQRAFLALQYLLPHHLLSKVVYRATRWKFGLWKNGLIKLIIWRFKPNLSEAESSTLDSYPSMNAFFTRSLKRGTRLIDASPGGLCSPADGVISQIGSIDQDRLIQAKGRTFSAEQLLGNDPAAKAFTNGQFTTIYLSPKDYHRIHMPLAGKLLQTTYVPGRLFSVAPLTTQHIPNLFARNERLACMFETEFGPMAVVLVGAMLVSSIETVWAGECGTLTSTPGRAGRAR